MLDPRKDPWKKFQTHAKIYLIHTTKVKNNLIQVTHTTPVKFDSRNSCTHTTHTPK